MSSVIALKNGALDHTVFEWKEVIFLKNRLQIFYFHIIRAIKRTLSKARFLGTSSVARLPCRMALSSKYSGSCFALDIHM